MKKIHKKNVLSFYKKNNNLAILFITILVILLITSLIRKPSKPAPSKKYFIEKQPQEEKFLTTTIKPTTIPSSTKEFYFDRAFSSLDGKYSLITYGPPNADNRCNFSLQDNKGSFLDLGNLIEVKTIYCSMGFGMEYSFIQWVDNNTLLLEEPTGSIIIFDIPNNSKKIYKYNTDELSLLGVDQHLHAFLFRKKEAGNDKSIFLVLGKDKQILKEVSFSTPFSQSIYDKENNGFLFINSYYTEESISTSFDFLFADNLIMKKLLNTAPVPMPDARDCPNIQLFSKLGEIIIDKGCYFIDPKYYGEDQLLHLPL